MGMGDPNWRKIGQAVWEFRPRAPLPARSAVLSSESQRGRGPFPLKGTVGATSLGVCEVHVNILRSLRTSVLGLVFAVVAGAACSGSSDVPPLNADCSINTDCNNPLVCAFKRCHNKCTSSRDCPEGQRCVKPTDVDTGSVNANVCQLPEETHCHLNSECADGLICGVDGLCRNQCDKDRDCLGGQISLVAHVCRSRRPQRRPEC